MKLKEVLILAQKTRQKSTTLNTFKFMTTKKDSNTTKSINYPITKYLISNE